MLHIGKQILLVQKKYLTPTLAAFGSFYLSCNRYQTIIDSKPEDPGSNPDRAGTCMKSTNDCSGV